MTNEDWFCVGFEQIGSELEYSNLPERALLRLAVGPLQLKVSYGLCHRLSAVVHAVHQYNYPEYTSTSSPSGQQPPLVPGQDPSQTAVDELVSMANNLPTRVYQVGSGFFQGSLQDSFAIVWYSRSGFKKKLIDIFVQDLFLKKLIDQMIGFLWDFFSGFF